MPVSHSRSSSSSPPPPAKRVKTEATSVEIPPLDPTRRPINYRDGVMLAPMVRSGTLPSRLLALKYGANLVWGPETVDKAIIGCDRVIDEKTGVVHYCRSNRSIFSCHPIERPYFIYQIGSSSPELAVQAALKVLPDVGGIDLNCGCPKPFSVHSGMGAALLTNPDLLCSILTALRKALPADVPVSAKIRLLPDQNDTLALVKRIVETGVSALTIHCRTRDMRPRESALVERLKEIVTFVEDLGLGVTVIENGDCTGRPDFERIKTLTGAHSVMVATAAESNLSCFASAPVVDAETVLAPEYARLAKYVGIPFGNAKHCLQQFSSPAPPGGASARKEFRAVLAQTKDYEGFTRHFGTSWLDGGEDIFNDIKKGIEGRVALEDALQHATQDPTTAETSQPSPLDIPLAAAPLSSPHLQEVSLPQPISC